MKEGRSIAIPVSSYLWGGGAELILIVVSSLSQVAPNLRIVFLINTKTSPLIKLYSSVINTIYRISGSNVKSLNIGIKEFIEHDPSFEDIKLLNTPYNSRHLNRTFDKYKIDLLFCSPFHPGRNFKFPVIGYITDIQHREIRKYFTILEIIRRDFGFNKLLKYSKKILTNSQNAKTKISHIYPKYKSKLSVIPTSIFPQETWFVKNMIDKYDLPNEYILVSNQFWKHKRHDILFKAFSLVSKGNKTLHLVCTGSTSDYRNPLYFSSLMDLLNDLKIGSNVRILGHIPKKDQISIMRKSRAVVQPSEFEGGPGGGSGYNAIALGVPLIVSDIAINYELPQNRNIHYFKKNSVNSLASCISKVLNKPYKNQSKEVLMNRGINSMKKCGNHLLKEINESIK